MSTASRLATADGRAPDPAHRLVIRRTLPAPPERVFEAWTRPHLVRRWFSPGALTVEEAELDVRVGGGYRIVMRTPEGEAHSPSGVYEEIVPNEKLVFTWRWEGAELVTRVTVRLRPAAEGKTELELTHEGFPQEEMRERHDEGWAGCLAKLPEALRTTAGAAGGAS